MGDGGEEDGCIMWDLGWKYVHMCSILPMQRVPHVPSASDVLTVCAQIVGTLAGL